MYGPRPTAGSASSVLPKIAPGFRIASNLTGTEKIRAWSALTLIQVSQGSCQPDHLGKNAATSDLSRPLDAVATVCRDVAYSRHLPARGQ